MLILLSTEVRRDNLAFENVVAHLTDYPDDDIRANVAANLHTKVWEESRVKLAQLLSSDEIAYLALYYVGIEITCQDWEVPGQELSAERDIEDARRATDQGVRAIQFAQEYISDPEFASTLLTEGRSGPPEDLKQAGPT